MIIVINRNIFHHQRVRVREAAQTKTSLLRMHLVLVTFMPFLKVEHGALFGAKVKNLICFYYLD